MTDTPIAPQVAALAAQGATPADVGSAVDNKGSITPDVKNINQPPVQKKTDDEVHNNLTPEQQAKEDKRIADAKAADEAAAKAKADEEAAKTKDEPKVITEYHAFEDDAGKAVVGLLKSKNVSPTEANAWFDEAVRTGDMTKINWTGLATKLSPEEIILVKAGVQQHYEGAYKQQTETIAAVHGVFGGEENWNKVVEWAQAKEGKDPAFKKTLDETRAQLKQHGLAAKLAAEHLKTLFVADPATKGLGIDKIISGDTNVNDVAEPMTRKEYYEASAALNKRKHTQQEEAVLWTRRQAGIAKGI